MKNFILILILILNFQSFTNANDVKDFQIEGMSIGDSLLDYMDENTIIKEMNKDGISHFYNDDFVLEEHNVMAIEERIRDIIYIKEINQILLFLETSGSIAVLNSVN